LEFDTYSNNYRTATNDFDQDIIGGSHIAYGYPGDPATYTDRGSGSSSNYYSMNHKGVNYVTLHDGKWHHLTISWDPTTFRITYKFNDKNMDGSKVAHPKEVTTEPINAKAFGGHGALSTNKLRWGFTANNGQGYEANLIAFESIPSSVEADVDSDITDVTQNKTIKTDSSDKTVNSGDNLAINYNLKYDSGGKKWESDVATLKLPSNVTYTNGDTNQIIGYVTYDDGSDSNAEPIYASELKDGTVTHTVAKDLYSDAPTTAKISIFGVADGVGQTTNVPSVRSKFDSTDLITVADTPEFTIKKSKPINLALDQSNISVNSEAAKITGTVSYTDASAVVNSQVKVHENLNGTDLDTFAMSDSDASGKVNFEVPANKLLQGSNTLKVYVTDEDGNRSTTSTVIITKTGSLDLKVDDYSFGDVHQATPSLLIPRKGTWNIVVDDTREKSTTSPWVLSASTAGLYNGTTPFKGNVVYKNSDGTVKNLSDNSLLKIASGSKNQDGEQMTNVGTSWNDAEGIMPKATGQNVSGHYSGTMNWVLSDTPE